MTTQLNITIQQLSRNKYNAYSIFSNLKNVTSQSFILFTSQRFYFPPIQLY